LDIQDYQVIPQNKSIFKSVLSNNVEQ